MLGSTTRRLAYFVDGAGKWRYIAISDWLTQLTLKPLHMYLAEYLKSIPQDATFEQHKVHTMAKLWSGLPVYSLDMTAMTDRLPLLLQMILLIFITGTGYRL